MNELAIGTEQRTAETAHLEVRVLRTESELRQFSGELADLAAHAIEPNVFYEPWVLLPAIPALGAGHELRFVLIRRAGEPSELTGFFPVELYPHYRHLPVRAMSMWQHKHCALCTPLVRAGFAQETLRLFVEWLASCPEGHSLMDFPRTAGEGEFHSLLMQCLERQARSLFVRERYSRPVLCIDGDFETYFNGSLSPHHRHEAGRMWRRLAQQGAIEFVIGRHGESKTVTMDTFLELEASGWKGRVGTAINCAPAERGYFLDLARSAEAREHMLMPALLVDGRPAAGMLLLRAGAVCFALKSAYDETFAKYSPGRLFTIELARALFGVEGLRCADSCTHSSHPMLEEWWVGKRWGQSTLAAFDRPSQLWLSLLPWMIRAGRRLRPALKLLSRSDERPSRRGCR